MAEDRTSEENAVGSGEFLYQPVAGWEKLPDGWSFVEVAGMATDSRDRVYVFNRGEHPIIVFDRDGAFLHAWGEGRFVRPHGIWIGPDDTLYLTDDMDHTVRKYTLDGQLLMTLGASGRPGDTGAQGFDYRTIERVSPPFNLPTNLALAPDGRMFVSDGYGNARIHRFSADGTLQHSWGAPGDAPAQFHVPHGIAAARDGRVLVADRENSRLQFFSPDGSYLEEWTDVVRPCEVFVDANNLVYVAELGKRAGLYPWMKPDPASAGGRVSIFDSKGALLARWGNADDPCAPDGFFAPHDIWVDSRGSLYIGEVTYSAGGKRGLVPPECPSLRKYVRKRTSG